MLANPADEISLLRVINTPARGIGVTTIRRLVDHARASRRQIFEMLVDKANLSGLGRSAARLGEFADLLRHLTPALEQSPFKALDLVMSYSGLRAMYRVRAATDDAPGANLDELLNAASVFEREHPEAKVREWLEHTALISDVDSVRDEQGMVTLMTLHAAKGLEFGHVYIIGLEDGLLPFRRQDEYSADEEEERRLCFVGMTRAKERLTLSRARYRMVRGATRRTVRSPFLDELPREQIEWEKRKASSARRRTVTDGGQLPEDIAEWTVGTLVRHPVHGLGQVRSLRPGLKRTLVDVQFKSGYRKTWVLEYAELERVEFDEVG